MLTKSNIGINGTWHLSEIQYIVFSFFSVNCPLICYLENENEKKYNFTNKIDFYSDHSKIWKETNHFLNIFFHMKHNACDDVISVITFKITRKVFIRKVFILIQVLNRDIGQNCLDCRSNFPHHETCCLISRDYTISIDVF